MSEEHTALFSVQLCTDLIFYNEARFSGSDCPSVPLLFCCTLEGGDYSGSGPEQG